MNLHLISLLDRQLRMDPKYGYTRTTYAYHASYVRNTRAVGVLWGLFTICFAIINVLVFMQPYWLGSTEKSPRGGLFGLYRYCISGSDSESLTTESCKGQFDSFDTILSPYFKAATILVGISALIILLCIACMLLFFFLGSKSVYCLCSWMQFFSCKCYRNSTEMWNWHGLLSIWDLPTTSIMSHCILLLLEGNSCNW